MLRVAAGALAKTKFREDRLRAAASNPALLATDAADSLVRRGVPFRQAHDLVGQVLREAEKQGKSWTQLSLTDVQKISPLFGEDFLAAPSVENAIAFKSVPGGTAEQSVRAAIAQLEETLRQLEKQT
jgi:argininosuccinate lyase